MSGWWWLVAYLVAGFTYGILNERLAKRRGRGAYLNIAIFTLGWPIFVVGWIGWGLVKGLKHIIDVLLGGRDPQEVSARIAELEKELGMGESSGAHKGKRRKRD